MMLQVGAAGPSSPIELISGSTGSTKVVLAILVLLSLISWTIMVAKAIEFRRAASAGRRFMDSFEEAPSLDVAADLARRSPPSPQRNVMLRALRFLHETTPALGATPARSARLSASQVEALRPVLDSESGAVRDQMGRFVPSLATIGSASPLIGLLGTVLGIIDAFVGVATEGAGNIGAVAPGIADALMTHAAAVSDA